MAYVPVLIMACMGLLVGGILLSLSAWLGRGTHNRRKDQPFECGMPVRGSARTRFSVKFYLVAILFLLFDVDFVYFLPWAMVFRSAGAEQGLLLLGGLSFALTLVLAYVYALRKEAFEWDEETDQPV
jgi:NADH-quinone oxidoreductase subunit A